MLLHLEDKCLNASSSSFSLRNFLPDMDFPDLMVKVVEYRLCLGFVWGLCLRLNLRAYGWHGFQAKF